MKLTLRADAPGGALTRCVRDGDEKIVAQYRFTAGVAVDVKDDHLPTMKHSLEAGIIYVAHENQEGGVRQDYAATQSLIKSLQAGKTSGKKKRSPAPQPANQEANAK